MSRLMRRPRLLMVAVFLLGALLAGSGVVVAAVGVNSGKTVTAVKVVTEYAHSAVTSSDTGYGLWTDIPGMSLSIGVPSTQKALLLITVSAETTCKDGVGSSTYCYVRVLVDGNEVGSVRFDSAADSNSDVAMESHSMQFVAGPLSAGSHTVSVQGTVDEQYSSFAFYTRTLSVLRSRV